MTTRQLQILTIALTGLPAGALTLRFMVEGAGANPVEELTHVSGEWALRWLLLSLAITPARRWLGWRWLAPLRRTLGLAAFVYASLHFTIWAGLDLGLDVAAITEDLSERPYVMVGMGAFLILLVLAATSTQGSIRRLGRRWVRLHRLVYVGAGLGVLHHVWLLKADLRPALVHAGLLAALLSARVAWRLRTARES
jgi:sulfoxide reductase heme-binding subunit YedZ